jgi:hypothetical protein
MTRARRTPPTFLAPLGLVLIFAAACGRDAAPPAESASDSVHAPDTAGAAPTAPSLLVSEPRPSRFPHTAHVEIACRLCHSEIPGHRSHAAVECAECHEVPAPGARSRIAAAECDACHHGRDQARACTDCHAAAPADIRSVTATVRTSVRAGAEQRSLPFAHARHGRARCADCHAGTPGSARPRECSECHDAHHTAESQCAACHPPPRAGEHDRSAHRGCDGAGCHADAAVARAAASRQACLVCHRDQQDHEPGGDCARCHLFRGDGADAAARPPPARSHRRSQ